MVFENPAASDGAFPFTFHGSYVRAVDAKGRFNLPFRLRKSGPADEEEKYVVTKGADGSLALLPHAVWIANFNRVREGEPGKQRREYLRRISHASHVVSPDSQGRIAIPAPFLEAAGIAKKVSVVGMADYMELWDPEVLDRQMSGPLDGDDDFINEFFR